MKFSIPKITIFLFSLFLMAGGLFGQAAARPLSAADQAEAGKKMMLMLAVDNRIGQLTAEIRQLQEQNASNRSQFEEWQKAKRKEYAAAETQSITLDLQWSPLPKVEPAAKAEDKKPVK